MHPADTSDTQLFSFKKPGSFANRFKIIKFYNITVCVILSFATIAYSHDTIDTGGIYSTDTIPIPLRATPQYKSLVAFRDEVTEFIRPLTTNLFFFRIEYESKIIPRFTGRFDFPFGWAFTNNQSVFGLSDIYAHGALNALPKADFQLPIGVALIAPSATSRLLGFGRWEISPLIYPIWAHKNFRYALMIRNFFAFGGDKSRTGLNVLDLSPEVKYNITKNWWVFTDIARIQVFWTRPKPFSAQTSLQVGHIFLKRIGAWTQYSVFWGSGRLMRDQVRAATIYLF